MEIADVLPEAFLLLGTYTATNFLAQMTQIFEGYFRSNSRFHIL
jgi:hypothetical protein